MCGERVIGNQEMMVHAATKHPDPRDAEIAALRAQLAELAQCRDHWKTSYEDVRANLNQAEEVIQGRNGRIVYLERRCAKADQDVKDASEDRGFAIKELAKVSAALEAENRRLRESIEDFLSIYYERDVLCQDGSGNVDRCRCRQCVQRRARRALKEE
jgi:predicted  nucleic acid-binding Zn-ribbon protein